MMMVLPRRRGGEFAILFDGSDDNARNADRQTTMEPAGDFTSAVRFRFDGVHSGTRYPYVFCSHNTSLYQWGITAFIQGANNIHGVVAIGGSNLSVLGPVAGAGWNNAATWRSGTDLYLRVNGVTYGPTAVGSAAISETGMRVHLGHSRDGVDANAAFGGAISRAGYWNSALSEAAIDAWFTGPVTGQSPAHAWALNEGTGTTTADAIGSITLTLLNGPTWEAV